MTKLNNYGTGFSINLNAVVNESPKKSFFDELSEAIQPYHQASKSQAMAIYVPVNHSKEFNDLIKDIENDKR